MYKHRNYVYSNTENINVTKVLLSVKSHTVHMYIPSEYATNVGATIQIKLCDMVSSKFETATILRICERKPTELYDILDHNRKIYRKDIPFSQIKGYRLYLRKDMVKK